MAPVILEYAPLMFWAFGFGLGLYWLFKGFREFRRYYVLADTPIVRIRGMAMGLVEIEGIARGEQQIFSPVSHTPCFYYKVDIEKWTTDSDGHESWVYYLTDQTGVSFYLQDTTGSVLIEPQGAELDLIPIDRRETGGGARSRSRFASGRGEKAAASPRVGSSDSELLSYISTAQTGLFLPQIVPVGPPSGHAESGTTSRRSSSPADARAEFDNYLRLLRRRRRAARTGGGLRAFLSRASSRFEGSEGDYGGCFRLTEYCIVPGRAYDITGTCTENPAPKDPNDCNMIAKGINEPTLLISSRTEEEIEGHLHQRAMMHIFGGGLLAAVFLAILIVVEWVKSFAN